MRRVSVVVYGPQACGKTRNAERLREAFRMDRVIDDWDGRTAIPFGGALVLTNDIAAFESDLAGMYRYTFEEAMQIASGVRH